jgi:hypothetical protein
MYWLLSNMQGHVAFGKAGERLLPPGKTGGSAKEAGAAAPKLPGRHPPVPISAEAKPPGKAAGAPAAVPKLAAEATPSDVPAAAVNPAVKPPAVKRKPKPQEVKLPVPSIPKSFGGSQASSKAGSEASKPSHKKKRSSSSSSSSSTSSQTWLESSEENAKPAEEDAKPAAKATKTYETAFDHLSRKAWVKDDDGSTVFADFYYGEHATNHVMAVWSDSRFPDWKIPGFLASDPIGSKLIMPPTKAAPVKTRTAKKAANEAMAAEEGAAGAAGAAAEEGAAGAAGAAAEESGKKPKKAKRAGPESNKKFYWQGWKGESEVILQFLKQKGRKSLLKLSLAVA